MKVELQVVESSIDLGAAIDLLKKSKQGALLAKHNDQFRLCSAGNIVVGRHRGMNTLADLQPEKTLGVGSQLPEMVLTRVISDNAILDISDIGLARRYVSSPKDYYCDGPRHHDDFPPPQVSEGDDCPHGDGHKIVSA